MCLEIKSKFANSTTQRNMKILFLLVVLTTNGIWAANLPLEENDALNRTSRQVGSPKKVDQYLSTTGFIFKKGVELIAGGKINVFVIYCI